MKPMKPSHFMNRVLLFVLLLVVGKGALSQERIDTLYYSRSGMTVRNPVFADYYRLALYPADAAGLKMFKDFYISGELRREGRFQTIDTLDDRRTVFDGDVVSYFKNGRMSAIRREWNVENTCVVCRRRIVRDVRGIQRRRLLPNGGISCRAAGS